MKKIELFNDHEEWREIPENNNYEVSNLGRVRSKNRIINQFGRKQNYDRIMQGKILKPRKQNGGYLLVWLCKDGECKAYTVHRLVAKCFVTGNGNDVNHKDGNKENNRADNLEWVNRAENIKHAYRCLGHPKTSSVRVVCVETGEVFDSMREAGKAKAANPISIGHVLAGRNKTAGGYTWKRK